MSFLDEDYCDNAPWKETDEEWTFRVSVTAINEITVKVPSGCDEDTAKGKAYTEVTDSLGDWKILDIDID